ncbi:hypothetical protein TTHERM_000549519 (macronuclear) [Tetrahymena thermophila SB210]|uniref:Uncharacterized protein n=1 Tax=Tetrahymena thermophila (strain SB210) TaxID=312017 RepID=W7XLR1_TETTS|nr:hypothetical protein TTHERM_000549519 [Tetrahymena thermophila SB210]EWS76729.1 hypothetical protein TTHERM_000549519 [Tetrahymena thermophila SB210]|eukprot:XP_012650722.1 hypothetical protein TTHERM_000549519 [Tetrahymena thermophila SB210]
MQKNIQIIQALTNKSKILILNQNSQLSFKIQRIFKMQEGLFLQIKFLQINNFQTTMKQTIVLSSAIKYKLQKSQQQIIQLQVYEDEQNPKIVNTQEIDEKITLILLRYKGQ